MRCCILFRTAFLVAVVLCLAAPASVGAASRPVSHVAGYQVAPPAGSTATASTRFTVPTLTCPSQFAFQAVLGGAELFIPGGSTGTGIVSVCNGQQAVYAPLLQVNGSSTLLSDAVAAGDVVTASVSEGPSSSAITVSDVTAGWTESQSGGGGSATSAVVGFVAGNCGGTPQCSPAPEIGPTTFTGSLLDGQPLSAGSTATVSDLTAGNGSVQIAAGPANRKTGAFSTTFRRSCVAPVNFGVC
jgi:hypothetical protein